MIMGECLTNRVIYHDHDYHPTPITDTLYSTVEEPPHTSYFLPEIPTISEFYCRYFET